MQVLRNVGSKRETVGYAVGGRHLIGHRHGWNPIRDNHEMNTEPLPVRGSVRIGTHCRAEAVHADGEWPPLEQDDTSDDLHESLWWQASSDDVARTTQAASTNEVADGRMCGDFSDVDAGGRQDAVVRRALREAMAAGLVSPAEAAESWPAAEPEPVASVETRDSVDADDFADGR